MKGVVPMNIVLEILYAIAAVATIGSFLHSLRTDYKKHGRSGKGSKGAESKGRELSLIHI